MRDMILSFVNSASLTKEAVNILTGTGEVSGQFATVIDWAKEGRWGEFLTAWLASLRNRSASSVRRNLRGGSR